MECISMVDVISHHLFPTVIHEFNLDIDTLDKKHMIESVSYTHLRAHETS